MKAIPRTLASLPTGSVQGTTNQSLAKIRANSISIWLVDQAAEPVAQAMDEGLKAARCALCRMARPAGSNPPPSAC